MESLLKAICLQIYALVFNSLRKHKLIKPVYRPKQWHIDDLCSGAADEHQGDVDADVNMAAAPSVDLTCVAATDVDGQGACGAEGGGPAVDHQDGQEVHILLMAVEA